MQLTDFIYGRLRMIFSICAFGGLKDRQLYVDKTVTGAGPNARILLFLHIIVFFAGLTGCGSSDKPAAAIVCPVKKEIPIERPSITQVNIFLDASGSMQGFMPAKITTNFQVLIPDFIERLRRDYSNASLFLLAQKDIPLSQIDIAKAREKIAKSDFKYGNSSALPTMLDSMAAHTASGKVSILITDCIYSPTADRLRMRDQAITDISTTISSPAKKKYGVSCFQLQSQYGAIFSPYYLFVCGTPQNVRVIGDELEKSLNTVKNNITSRALNEIHFGYPELSPFYSIIPYADNTGAAEPVECPEWENRVLVMKNADVQMGLEFWIGLDLSALPAFAKQPAYLQNNLVVEGKNMQANRIGSIPEMQQFMSKATDPADKRLSNKCSHFIKIKVVSIERFSGAINISLKKIQPNWVAAYNHNISDSAELKRDQTFGLANITDGMADAYRNNESNFFFKDLTISVFKN